MQKIGVTQGHWKHRQTPLDRAQMTSYLTLIETIGLRLYLVPFSSYSAFFVKSDQF